MKNFDIRDEKGFPKICNKCVHTEVCYYLNEYGECTHCSYFTKQKLDKENKKRISKKIKNIDFDSLDFSKYSIDEKFWVLLLLIFWTCKDAEFIKSIKERFELDKNNEAVDDILAKLERTI